VHPQEHLDLQQDQYLCQLITLLSQVVVVVVILLMAVAVGQAAIEQEHCLLQKV
jgi:hypothetical protein